MTVFSYHLVKPSFATAVRLMIFPVTSANTEGLIHAETMSAMILGSGVFSPTRFFNRELVVFAQWETEEALEHFLKTNKVGRQLKKKGWHVRLEFIRQWGSISGFRIDDPQVGSVADDQSVVAVTIARMKYAEIPRFLRWGRPVEKLVRDHKGTVLSLASIRYPNVISTFSIWKTQKEMTDMVHGHSKMPQPKRHIDAMKERNRKDFHFEFTTLRFKPISEHGSWKTRSHYLSSKPETAWL